MTIERTLSIIKPNITKSNQIGEIQKYIESANLKIIAIKMKWLTKKEAQGFYVEHFNKPFFNDLVNFMTSAPIVVQVLEGENAIQNYRELMGKTDPNEAAPNTIRAKFALSKQENAVHGSDSEKSAMREIAYFFSECELCAN